MVQQKIQQINNPSHRYCQIDGFFLPSKAKLFVITNFTIFHNILIKTDVFNRVFTHGVT